MIPKPALRALLKRTLSLGKKARKNNQTKAKGSPARRKAVLEQKKD